jgi:chromosome segregation ATPase
MIVELIMTLQADLSQARAQIEDLEEGNRELVKKNTTLQTRIQKLLDDDESRSKELSSLRNRTNLSQQNWSSEREDLISREAFAREEFEAAKQAMQGWEILAMEERSVRENVAEKVADLEEQLASQRELFESAVSDRDTQSSTVDQLQRALQQLQTGEEFGSSAPESTNIHLARKQELRELVENNQTQVDSLKRQLQESEKTATEAETSLQSVKKELGRALPFEKEVKEKNLLIGKQRHEAVILNDHLTKALRYLKKGEPEDNVNRLECLDRVSRVLLTTI